MTRSRLSCTVYGLMTLVALIAIGIAAFRFHFSVGCFVAALFALAICRFVGISRRCQENGRPLERQELAGIVIRCTVVSFVILGSAAGVSLLVFLVGREIEGGARRSPDAPLSVLVAVVVAWYIAKRGERELWRSPRCIAPCGQTMGAESPQCPEVIAKLDSAIVQSGDPVPLNDPIASTMDSHG